MTSNETPWERATCVCSLSLLLALDDTIALRQVLSFVTARLDVDLTELIRHFAVRCDEALSVAQVGALLDD